MQHGMAERDAVGEHPALEVMAADVRHVGCHRRRHFGELARGNDLGEHHGGRLQSLFFILGIVPAGAVLDDQNADSDARPAGPARRGTNDRFLRPFRADI